MIWLQGEPRGTRRAVAPGPPKNTWKGLSSLRLRGNPIGLGAPRPGVAYSEPTRLQTDPRLI